MTKTVRSKSIKSNPETSIQSQILKHLKSLKLFVKRETNQNIRTIRGRIVNTPSDVPGWPDIIGVFPDGKMFAVEVKTSTGKLSKVQQQTKSDLEANNVMFVVARSVSDLGPIESRLKECISNGLAPTPSQSLELHHRLKNERE